MTQFIIKKLCHINEQMISNTLDLLAENISHDEYRFNYNKQYILEKIPKHLPSHLGNASVLSFKCSQYRYRPSRPSNYPNELDKQRHREAMNTYDCHGTINIYFSFKSRRTFNHCNEPVDVMIIVRHDFHLGREESDVPAVIRNWIKANPRFNSTLQRDDFLIAISRDEIENIHKNFYINTTKMYY